MAYLWRSLEEVWPATEHTARKPRTDSAPLCVISEGWRRLGAVLLQVDTWSHTTLVQRQMESFQRAN